MKEPKVHVGILSETKIEFIFPDTYRVNEKEVSGKQLVLFLCTSGKRRTGC